MTTSSGSLPPKLQAVLMRLGRAASLNVTQAVKLPYLVDVVASNVLGAPITEGSHQAWDNGVVTSEAWHHLTKCEGHSFFHLESVPWSEERRLVIEVDGPESALTPEEGYVTDIVAAEFSSIRAGDLGRMTKYMNPSIGAWGSNRRASTGPDAYERMSPDYLEMANVVASTTLDRLRRDSTPVVDLEDAIA